MERERGAGDYIVVKASSFLIKFDLTLITEACLEMLPTAKAEETPMGCSPAPTLW